MTIEDAFDEDDWPNWSSFVSRFGKEVQIVGDDLTVTNPTKISRAVEDKAANALLLKVNQIGSVTEAIPGCEGREGGRVGRHDFASFGRDGGHLHRRPRRRPVHRANQNGGTLPLERLAKYNQLLRIEEARKCRVLIPHVHKSATAKRAPLTTTETAGTRARIDAPYAGSNARTPPWMG